MKRYAIAGSVAVICIIAAIWLIGSLRAKFKYDEMRRELSMAYAVTPMDAQMRAFLIDVESNWTCKYDNIGGPDSEVVKLAGMTPSVQNLISVFNYRIPEYSWFSPARNRRAAKIGLLKAKFFPVSVDKQWHTSEDQHLALLRAKTNVVCVYQDASNGLRAAMYYTKNEK